MRLGVEGDHAGDISHHRWVFIKQSLSFGPSALLHSPTQLTPLPIRSVKLADTGDCLWCKHMLVRVFWDCVKFLRVRILRLWFECQFKEIVIFGCGGSNRDDVGWILKHYSSHKYVFLMHLKMNIEIPACVLHPAVFPCIPTKASLKVRIQRRENID